MDEIGSIDWRKSINSLTEFQERIGLVHDINLITFLISEQIPQMIPLDAFAIALADIETSEFILSTVQPKGSKELFQKEMNAQIDSGLFAWAITERKYVIVPSTVFDNKTLLMFPLGTSVRPVGMFFIITPLHGESVPYQYLWGLNLMIAQSSLALENALLYNELDKARESVEVKAERLEGISHATIESVADGILVIGTDGRIILANPISAKLLDTTVDNLSGNYLMNVTKDIPLLGLFQKKLSKGKHYTEEFSIVDRKTGEQKILSGRISSVLMKGGKTLGVVIALRDVTREKEIDRMKSEFVSNVSHELRTPLGSIKLFVDTLLGTKVSDNERKEFLTIIDQEADRLTQLIEDLLDLSRIESGRMRLTFEPVNISEVIDRVKTEVLERCVKKGLSLETEVPDSLPMVRADKNALLQVFVNLVINAIKFTEEGGKISIKADLRKKHIRIEVQDTGIGIEEKHMEKIFEKFYRIETASHKISGTGLGLAIVKELVEKHKGKIWAKSKLGKGSTFYFTIPLLPHPG